MESNVRLRELEEKDAGGMLEWMQDPAINRFFRFDAAGMTYEKCLVFIQNARAEKNCRHWAIVNGQDTYLGTISLKNITPERAEYAISTCACAHGTGAAMEATRQVLSVAFEQWGLREVYLNVLTENARANAFYRKAGFQFRHREAGALVLRGEEKDLNWYSMERDDYDRT